jgi:hypothetical protein
MLGISSYDEIPYNEKYMMKQTVRQPYESSQYAPTKENLLLHVLHTRVANCRIFFLITTKGDIQDLSKILVPKMGNF